MQSKHSRDLYASGSIFVDETTDATGWYVGMCGRLDKSMDLTPDGQKRKEIEEKGTRLEVKKKKRK